MTSHGAAASASSAALAPNARLASRAAESKPCILATWSAIAAGENTVRGCRRPALAARDGKDFEPGEIPDGVYLVDDTGHPQPGFQQAVIAAVAKVTHIAPADAQGEIIGSPVVAPGVIRYPLKPLGLCAGVSNARYTTTTEVYPDSPRATPEQCNAAQVAAVRAALDYLLAQG